MYWWFSDFFICWDWSWDWDWKVSECMRFILWCDIVKSVDKVGKSLGIMFSRKKTPMFGLIR